MKFNWKLILILWLFSQLVVIATLRFLPWGNFVDMTVWMSGMGRSFPLAWYAIRTHGKKYFSSTALFKHASFFSFSTPINHPIGQWQKLAADQMKEKLPLIRDLFLQRLGQPKEIDACVVHLRLGDVPFVRNELYKLPPYSCIRAALVKAAELDSSYKSILFICSTRHKSNPSYAAASALIAQAVANDFGATLLMNRSEEEDLRSIRDAKVRITFSSSFSFYAALASEGPWINLSFNPMNLSRPLVTDMPITEVHHTDVKDYLEVPAVLHHMRSK